MICPHCNLDLETISNKANRGNHVRWCSQNHNKLINKQKQQKICPECNNIHTGRGVCCSNICARKYLAKSAEWKEKISQGRIKFLSENPDKHPWKNNNKFKSEPCENIKKYLKLQGIQFIGEYQPIENRFFSIDIAFPDVKIGIEVNGNQHYNKDGTLKPYYQKRHDLITQYGWKLIELHYSQCYNKTIIENLIEKWEQPDYTIYIKEKIQIEEALPKGKRRSNNIRESYKDKIEEVKNSDLDFSKFGWVGKVSKIVGITPQKTGAWMQRYLPEIYEKAFKRKN